jgi:hypothetical protein
MGQPLSCSVLCQSEHLSVAIFAPSVVDPYQPATPTVVKAYPVFEHGRDQFGIA